MVALDVSPEVVQQAVGQKADMLITHHPPIFKPLKNICDSSWQSDLLLKCIENGIAVYSAHTSLDSVLGGVNDVLAEKLGLEKTVSLVKMMLTAVLWGALVICRIKWNLKNLRRL